MMVSGLIVAFVAGFITALAIVGYSVQRSHEHDDAE